MKNTIKLEGPDQMAIAHHVQKLYDHLHETRNRMHAELIALEEKTFAEAQAQFAKLAPMVGQKTLQGWSLDTRYMEEHREAFLLPPVPLNELSEEDQLNMMIGPGTVN